MQEPINAFLRLESGQVEGYKQSDLIPLTTDTLIIGRPGRETGSGIVIPYVKTKDYYVSHDHVKIYYRDDKHSFVVEERASGSKNGTFIGREQNNNLIIRDRLEAGKPYSLVDGDFVALAKVGQGYRLVFRFKQSDGTIEDPTELEEGSQQSGLTVDIAARKVLVDGKEVYLRKKEFDLLSFLYEHRGKACNREEIIKEVWVKQEGIVDETTIEAVVYRIREVIERDPKKPQYIKCLRGYGYRLDK